jgi:hypothetical protein
LTVIDSPGAFRVVPLNRHYGALLRPVESGSFSESTEAIELTAFDRKAATPKAVESVPRIRFDDEGSRTGASAFGVVADLRTNLFANGLSAPAGWSIDVRRNQIWTGDQAKSKRDAPDARSILSFLPETLGVSSSEEAVSHPSNVVTNDPVQRVAAIPMEKSMRVVEKELK